AATAARRVNPAPLFVAQRSGNSSAARATVSNSAGAASGSIGAPAFAMADPRKQGQRLTQKLGLRRHISQDHTVESNDGSNNPTLRRDNMSPKKGAQTSVRRAGKASQLLSAEERAAMKETLDER